MTGPTNFSRELDLASLLNEAQYRAATHSGGPLLIVAGAGSGKTRTLVHRVAWLVEKGTEPSSILLVTFTRKAAAEMLSRCSNLVGSRAGRVSGGTYHSLANNLLRRYAHQLGYTSNFVILDQDDAEDLIGRIRENELGTKSGRGQFPKKSTILNVISQAVNCDKTLASLINSSHPHLCDFLPLLEKIRKEYARLKKKHDLMDFDDLLVNLEAVMRQGEETRRRIAGLYSHVLVDEYQDTNSIQARLTFLLGQDHLNVTAVGDEAQSIYSFRGASYKNIMDFPNIFKSAAIIKLEDNYRSRPEILKVANHLLSQAKHSFKKVLRPNREPGPKPKILILDNLAEEAMEVVDRIRTLADQGVPLTDIAVLFRASSHSFELESLLTKSKIPFSKFGGRKFLEMAHVKDYLCLLRLALNPGDALSLSRIIKKFDGLGPASVNALLDFVGRREDNFRRLHEAKLPVGKAKDELYSLSELLTGLASEATTDSQKALLAYKWYSERISKFYPDDAPSRAIDTAEVRDMALAANDLVTFLADLSLDPPNTLQVGGPNERAARSDLTLSTVHSAKGLEWPYVFIISVVDGRFPSPYSRSKAEADEELRLLYVAATRAMDELVITIPLNYAMGYDGDGSPSTFLAGLSGQTVKVYKWGSLVPGDEPLGPVKRRSERAKSDNESGDNKPPRKLAPAPPEQTRPATLKTEDSSRPGHVPKLGELVRHPFYGAGKVLKLSASTATIDFELYGRKNVMIAFAKLTLLDG